MIQFDHLTKEYNGIPAVNDLTTGIAPGEIFGLLGPNGAGKSTTILMLVGLIEPTSGCCRIDGIEVTKNPVAVKNMIGYMPEDVGFYSKLTAEENLAYFAKLYHMDRKRYQKRIDDLLVLTGLDGITKPVGGFSKGMRQRLGIANALLNDPGLIILDEPTANLDPPGVADYRRIIRDVSREGKTVIVSSHILPEVSRVCTSIGLLLKGRLIAQGRVEDLDRQLMPQIIGQSTILIETRDPMPEFTHQDLISAEYNPDRTRGEFTVKSDIRYDIVEALAAGKIGIREIVLKRATLEDLFLSYCRVGG